MLQPGPGMHRPGRALLLTVLGWSIYRLATRSPSRIFTVLDVAVIVAVASAIPLLTTDPAFYLTNSAPQAIAGTAVISIAVSLPPRWSLPLTATIAAAYAWGTSVLIGWRNVEPVLAVYYFALQWLTSALIRAMVRRVAAVADSAREAREVAEAARDVEEAVRLFDREQLGLLHDTVASTLLIVGQGVTVPAHRLAAQARRDLGVLRQGPWSSATQRGTDIVTALNKALTHVRTPASMTGRPVMVLPGVVAQAVIATCREALNNVDRHARATTVGIHVLNDRVVVEDDGVGIESTAPVGHGIGNSMTGRMQRVHGAVNIHSVPGAGTRVEVSWPTTAQTQTPAHLPVDPERLIDRARSTYALALVAYAIANLLTTVPYATTHTHRAGHLLLATVAALAAMASIPLRRRPMVTPVAICLAVLFVILAINSITLLPNAIGTQADWVQAGIGWCALPLILPLPIRRGAAVLVGLWAFGAAAELIVRPGLCSWVNIGLGTGSILGVQLFALAFDGLVRSAATSSTSTSSPVRNCWSRSKSRAR